MQRDETRSIEIHRAPDGGFCFGVEQAVQSAKAAALESTSVYTFGEVVHNPDVVCDLARRGIRVAKTPEAVPAGATVIIRSHGVAPAVLSALQKRGVKVLDATCPRVRQVQRAAERYTAEGASLVLVGRLHHPEVQGVMGRCPNETEVIASVDEAEALPDKPARTVLFQTTFSPPEARAIVEALDRRTGDLVMEKTLCPVVQARRESVRNLAKKVDLLVVVGGKNSSNTQALLDIGLEAGTRTLSVETAKDTEHYAWMIDSVRSIGVVGGTSTPRESLDAVCNAIRAQIAMEQGEPLVRENESAHSDCQPLKQRKGR